MNNKEIIGALSMDLLRAALGLHRGAKNMAKIFLSEALKRKEEIDTVSLSPYIKNLIDKFSTVVVEKDDQKKAEDFLMYSILFKNYTQKI